MAERKKLFQIASTAWEHPADRAALNTLRSIPGFDVVVRKIASFFGEVGIRQLFLANAVKIGPNQRPRLWAIYQQVLDTMDWPEVPELYVTQTPLANAAAVGFDKPFIVMNSALLELLDEEEQRDGARGLEHRGRRVARVGVDVRGRARGALGPLGHRPRAFAGRPAADPRQVGAPARVVGRARGRLGHAHRRRRLPLRRRAGRPRDWP